MDRSPGQHVTMRTAASDGTRERLLRAAAELIAELGWGGVTTRAVAARAELPHGTVSYHFRGKQELLTEAALSVLDQAFPADAVTALGHLGDLLDLFERWLAQDGPDEDLVSRVGIEAMLESQRNELLRHRLASLLRTFRNAVTGLARTASDRGELRAGIAPEHVAALIGAIGDGLFLHARLDPDFRAKEALATLRALLAP